MEFCSCCVEWCKAYVCQGYRENWKQLICGRVSVSNILQRETAGRKGRYWLSVFICLLTDCAHHKYSDVHNLNHCFLVPYYLFWSLILTVMTVGAAKVWSSLYMYFFLHMYFFFLLSLFCTCLFTMHTHFKNDVQVLRSSHTLLICNHFSVLDWSILMNMPWSQLVNQEPEAHA